MEQENIIINKCIYCDGAGETDEHIIPFALGGKVKLINASCESCRTITSKCELNPLKENWEEVRAVLNYPSRHRNFSNKKFPLKVTLKDGSEKILELPKVEAAGLAIFVEYQLPAFFAPSNYKSGIKANGSDLISFGTPIEILGKKYGFKKVEYGNKYIGIDFPKMVAKIGYCAAVAVFGIDSFDKRFVLPALLDKKDDIGFWMGCDHKGIIAPLIGKQSDSNAIVLHILEETSNNTSNNTRYVLARLKFFALSDSPEYIVVIGTLKQDFIIPDYQSLSY